MRKMKIVTILALVLLAVVGVNSASFCDCVHFVQYAKNLPPTYPDGAENWINWLPSVGYSNVKQGKQGDIIVMQGNWNRYAEPTGHVALVRTALNVTSSTCYLGTTGANQGCNGECYTADRCTDVNDANLQFPCNTIGLQGISFWRKSKS